MKLTIKQRGVILGMGSGLVLTILVLTASSYLACLHSIPVSRLEVFALSAIGPALVFAFSIGRIAAHRFFTSADIDGNGLSTGSQQVKLLQGLLQNTLEQMLLALAVYAIGTVLFTDPWLLAILASSVLFVCGRILFFWGYARGAASRSLGFALTFYPTILLLLVCGIFGIQLLLAILS